MNKRNLDTPFQIMTSIRNTREQPRNSPPLVKAALDKEKTAPKDGLQYFADYTTGVGAPTHRTGGEQCVNLL